MYFKKALPVNMNLDLGAIPAAEPAEVAEQPLFDRSFRALWLEARIAPRSYDAPDPFIHPDNAGIFTPADVE